MPILTMTHLLLTLALTVTDTPMTCLTPIQVRTANLMLDECDRDRELLTIKQAEVEQLDAALATSIAISERLQTERDHLLQLDSLNRSDIERLRIAGQRAERKVSRRTRWMWILGAVAAVETAIIGVEVAR
jgi:hypothetical protein